MLKTILIALLIIFCVGALPVWPYAHSLQWGYYPSGGMGIILLILLILALTGRI